MKTTIKKKSLDGAIKPKKLSKIGEYFQKNKHPLIVVYDIRAVNK